MKSTLPITNYQLLIILVVLFFISLTPFSTLAEGQTLDDQGCPSDAPYCLGKVNKLKSADPVVLTATVINYVLGLLGAGVFVVFLVGGGRILFSAGNPKMVEGGKKTLVYAVIGLAVIFLSYAVLNFFFTILQKGAG